MDRPNTLDFNPPALNSLNRKGRRIVPRQETL
jgi:hypothetical protein